MSHRVEGALLTLRRAKTVADLELVAEQAADTPEAREAVRRLHDARAERALRLGEEGGLRAFLERYPESPRAAEVRGRLAHPHAGDES